MSDRPQADSVTLLVDGRVYGGWTDIRVTRSLEQAAASFALAITQRWANQAEDWPILPFAAVELRFGEDLVITGYADALNHSIAAGKASINITGRSKTMDLIDCTPEIEGTEFRRSTLPAIARALAAPFNIEVVEEVDAGAPFALEAFDRTDTAFETIARLARMRSVLVTDDERGRLVLTRASDSRAAGRLVLGKDLDSNLQSAEAEFNGAKRFSRYIVLAQQPSAAANDIAGDGDETDAEPAQRSGGGDAPAIIGTATDAGVPRYRPRVIRAEGDGTAADAVARANWAATTAAARAISLTVEVPGWRQPDGTLWRPNQLVPCLIPRMQLDRDLLVSDVEFTLAMGSGRTTKLTLTPPEALTPEPLADKGGGGGGGRWRDVELNSGRIAP